MPAVWGGHSCPPLLTLIFVGSHPRDQAKPLNPKPKSTAADRSVRPTPGRLAGGADGTPIQLRVDISGA
jgi:hypothetical protein